MRVVTLRRMLTMLKIATLATLATAILLAAPVAARANDYFDTGNQYWDRRAGKENIVCTATAGTFYDMMGVAGYECTASGITRVQVRDVLLKALVAHPETRNYPMSVIAVVAFIDAFGCKTAAKH